MYKYTVKLFNGGVRNLAEAHQRPIAMDPLPQKWRDFFLEKLSF